MNRLIRILMVCWAVGAVTACSDDDQPAFSPTPTINIVQNDLVFDADGHTAIVIVDAEGEISATTDADWCEAAVSGHTVTVTAQPNADFTGRTALLTITAGAAQRQLPVQQLGLVLDLPLTVNGHYSPNSGDSFTMNVNHSLPMEVSSPQSWIHPVLDGSQLKVTVDANEEAHIRRGIVTFQCGGYADTLRVGQYDMMNDVVGTYYMMGSYGGTNGAPTATRFDIIMRNDSLLMHWPQENFANTYIPLTIDKADCAVYIPGRFTLRDDSRATVVANFYDTEGIVATNSEVAVEARLVYLSSSGVTEIGANTAMPKIVNWPGHELGGFIIRQSTLVITSTLIQLADPILIRVGPVGTQL